MFLITCNQTDTPMLQGTRAITAVRQTPHGVELLATCRCGATVHLQRGVQVSHGPTPGPSGAKPAATAPREEPTGVAVGGAGLAQMRGISV